MLKLIRNLSGNIILILALVFTAIITIASLVKPTHFPKTDITFSDKIAHILAYASLGFLWLWWSFRRSNLKQTITQYALVIAFVILYGIFIEIMQDVLTDYRSFDYMDMIANSMGVFIGWLFFKGFKQYFNNFNNI